MATIATLLPSFSEARRHSCTATVSETGSASLHTPPASPPPPKPQLSSPSSMTSSNASSSCSMLRPQLPMPSSSSSSASSQGQHQQQQHPHPHHYHQHVLAPSPKRAVSFHLPRSFSSCITPASSPMTSPQQVHHLAALSKSSSVSSSVSASPQVGAVFSSGRSPAAAATFASDDSSVKKNVGSTVVAAAQVITATTTSGRGLPRKLKFEAPSGRPQQHPHPHAHQQSTETSSQPHASSHMHHPLLEQQMPFVASTSAAASSSAHQIHHPDDVVDHPIQSDHRNFESNIQAIHDFPDSGAHDADSNAAYLELMQIIIKGQSLPGQTAVAGADVIAKDAVTTSDFLESNVVLPIDAVTPAIGTASGWTAAASDGTLGRAISSTESRSSRSFSYMKRTGSEHRDSDILTENHHGSGYYSEHLSSYATAPSIDDSARKFARVDDTSSTSPSSPSSMTWPSHPSTSTSSLPSTPKKYYPSVPKEVPMESALLSAGTGARDCDDSSSLTTLWPRDVIPQRVPPPPPPPCNSPMANARLVSSTAFDMSSMSLSASNIPSSSSSSSSFSSKCNSSSLVSYDVASYNLYNHAKHHRQLHHLLQHYYQQFDHRPVSLSLMNQQNWSPVSVQHFKLMGTRRCRSMSAEEASLPVMIM